MAKLRDVLGPKVIVPAVAPDNDPPVSGGDDPPPDDIEGDTNWTPPAKPPKVKLEVDTEPEVEPLPPKPPVVDPPTPTPTPKPSPVADPRDEPLTIKYQGSNHELTYLALPEHRRATDTTDAVTGFGRSTTTQKRDVLSQMTVGDQILLLAENKIHLSAKSTKKHKEPIGSMYGYRMLAKELKASDESVVRFRALKILPENSNRIDNFSYAYREYASTLYEKFAFQGHLGAGVPDIFEFSTSASHKTGVVETGENIELHFQASQMIPKARVVFKKTDISLDEEFVEKIKDACNKNDIAELLNLLERNGQFVPLSISLGGRIIITESKTVASRSAFDTQKNELHAAAAGKYVYDGVTIKGDAAAGIGKEYERENTLTVQQKTMTMVCIGGDGRQATSQTDELGTHWIDTVAPFLGWKIIGFEPKALVPIIEFLDKECADKCKAMLRKHFVAHLGVALGKTAGDTGNKTFERDIKNVNQLKSFVVNHDGNVDGMKLNYEVYFGQIPGGRLSVRWAALRRRIKSGSTEERITTHWSRRLNKTGSIRARRLLLSERRSTRNRSRTSKSYDRRSS